MFTSEITIKFSVKTGEFEVFHCGVKKLSTPSFIEAAQFSLVRFAEEPFGHMAPIQNELERFNHMIEAHAVAHTEPTSEPDTPGQPEVERETEPGTDSDGEPEVEVPANAVAQVSQERREERAWGCKPVMTELEYDGYHYYRFE